MGLHTDPRELLDSMKHREHRQEDRRQDFLFARSRGVCDLHASALGGSYGRSAERRIETMTQPRDARWQTHRTPDTPSPHRRDARHLQALRAGAGQRPHLPRPLAGRDPCRARRKRRGQNDPDEHPLRDVSTRQRRRSASMAGRSRSPPRRTPSARHRHGLPALHPGAESLGHRKRHARHRNRFPGSISAPEAQRRRRCSPTSSSTSRRKPRSAISRSASGSGSRSSRCSSAAPACSCSTSRPPCSRRSRSTAFSTSSGGCANRVWRS